jgi:hypothetical protein
MRFEESVYVLEMAGKCVMVRFRRIRVVVERSQGQGIGGIYKSQLEALTSYGEFLYYRI